MTPMKAIRAKCLDCCCGSSEEVKLCPCEKCSLWVYRLGTNPFIQKREYTEEDRQKMRERLAANLAKKPRKSSGTETEGGGEM